MLHYEDWGSLRYLSAYVGRVVVGVRHALQVDQAGGLAFRRHAAGLGDFLARSYQRCRAEIRTQFHHIIDVVPTILEAAGVKAPTTVDGIAQKPIEGVSMAYTFDKANAHASSKAAGATAPSGFLVV